MTVTPETITTESIASSSTQVGIDMHSVTLSDGSYIVAYVASDGDATAGHDIMAQQFDAIGNKIGGEMLLASTVTTDTGLQFDIVALENNQIAFGFENFGDIQVEVFDIANGVATQNAVLSQTINTPGSDLLDVALSGNSMSTLKLSHIERTGTTNTAVEQFDVAGGVFTGSSNVATFASGDAGIELDSDTLANGNTVVVVDRDGATTPPPTSFNILITDPNGSQVFVDSFLLNTDISEPRVTALQGGGFVVVFAGTNGADRDVFYHIFENDGTVRAGPFRPVDAGADLNDDPEVIALDDGGFFFVWDSDTAANPGLFGRRFDSDGVGVGNLIKFNDGAAATILSTTLLEDGRLAVSYFEGGDVNTRLFSTEVPAAIDGTDNNDDFDGTSGNDTLNGLDGDDTIDGDEGNDIFDGGAGDDSLRGNDGDDLFIGGSGADTMIGGVGDDTISYANSDIGLVVNFLNDTGSTGDAAGDVDDDVENLIGTAFDDTLTGSAGMDVDAGEGDDLITGLRNGKTLQGGEGDDTISYALSGETVIINLGTVDGPGGSDRVLNVENAIGSVFIDFIDGSDAANVLLGQSGNDKINGFAGNDLLLGGRGNDDVSGGDGRDTLNGEDGNDDLLGDAGDDVITGGIGLDTVDGGAGADNIEGGAGSDSLSGGDDDDTVTGEGGDDSIEGGNGQDLLSGGDGADTVGGNAGNDELNGGAGNDLLNGDAGDDIINVGAGTDVANGGTGNDLMISEGGFDALFGNEGQDTISGGNGGDRLSGGSGDDEISGGQGVDAIVGGSGDDTLDGGTENDEFQAGVGNDLLIGGGGADFLVGEGGVDTADYTASAAGVEVDLFVAGTEFRITLDGLRVLTYTTAGTGIGGDAQGDRLAEIENILGSAFDDELTGDVEKNRIEGGDGEDEIDGDAGDDTLLGGADDDTIAGGDGRDELDGGTGTDTARFAGNQADFAFAALSGGSVSATAQNGEVDILSNFEFLEFLDGTVAIGDVIGGGNPGGGDVPTPGNDVLTGTENIDNINGLGGDDLITGLGGADLLSGAAGNDTVAGDQGADRLFGNGGDDSIEGGQGADSAFGGTGDDVFAMGSENDSVLGQGNNDTILGEAGNDTLRGGSGNDSIEGGDDDDDLFGNGNNDTILGGEGEDSIQGNAGADRLFGEGGDDTIFGGIGGDRLDGGAGNDLLNGGTNDGVRDVFVFLVGYDQDRVNQFDQAGTDRLELDEDLWLASDGVLSAQQVVDTFGVLNGNATILTLDFGEGDILEVQNSGGIDQATLGGDVLIV